MGLYSRLVSLVINRLVQIVKVLLNATNSSHAILVHITEAKNGKNLIISIILMLIFVQKN